MTPRPTDHPPHLFPTTHWSLVNQAAGRSDLSLQRQALASLLSRYLAPLKSHLIRRKRIDEHRADDLLQGFLSSKIIEQDLITRAERERGKFRTFLLTALDHYLISERRRETAVRRSPGPIASLDHDAAGTFEPAVDPDDQFDADWARSLLHQATQRMQAECAAAGRDDVWGIFDARILRPSQGQEPLPYDQLIQQFDLPSPMAASNLLITAKRTFTRHLRALIAEYVKDPQEIETELRDLHRALAGA